MLVHDAGLHNITKTLLLSILLRTNEEYVSKFDLLQDIIDNEDTCWGSGVYLNDTAVFRQTWHKVIVVCCSKFRILGYDI